MGELVELYDETAAPSTIRMFSSLFLPSRYADLYDFALMRRLHVCHVVVAGRLQDRWEPPRCRGEELVLRAVIDHAETCPDEEADEPSDSFGDLREWLFEDLHHEYLFNPAYRRPRAPAARLTQRDDAAHPSSWKVEHLA